MKKLSAIIIAMALVLGMSQCKKQETPATPTNNDGMVYITVNVGDNGGKHTVYPNHGLYGFDNGDILYVGNNGHFVGTLEYQDGAFSGGIQSPSTNDYLHFYFLGGKGPQSPSVGTESLTISIADQSGNLPILSYGRSTVKYSENPTTTYSTTLRNKCALVKFGFLLGTTDAVTVANMLTEATINFGNTENAIVPTADQTPGTITLYPESEKAKWAILLPQGAVDNAPVAIGSSGGYLVNVPLIEENDFAPEISTIINNTITWDNTSVFIESNMNVEVSRWGVGSATLLGITITLNQNGNNASSFQPYQNSPFGATATLRVFGNFGDSYTFKAPSGKKFTKIEIVNNGSITFTAHGGWTSAGNNKIEWNGTAANEVTLGGGQLTYCDDLNSIVFTLVDDE